MKTILFVCLGNVGRSQMAEAYFNKYYRNAIAASAGVDPLTPIKYSHPAPAVVEVMKEDGIDVSEKIVKYITAQMVDDAEFVIIMCQKDECPKFLQESTKTTFWEIDDPYGTSMDNFRAIRDQIKAKVLELLKK